MSSGPQGRTPYHLALEAVYNKDRLIPDCNGDIPSHDRNSFSTFSVLLYVILNLKERGVQLFNNNNNNRIQRRYSRFFYNLLTVPRTVSNTYAQVARAQSCANHVQHIERLSRASVM